MFLKFTSQIENSTSDFHERGALDGHKNSSNILFTFFITILFTIILYDSV